MPNDVGSVKYKILGDNSQFQKDVSKTQEIATKVATGIGKAFTAAATAAATAIAAAGKVGIEYNAKMEQYVTAFRTLMDGNEEAANSMIDTLRKLAAATPLGMSDLAQNAQTLMGYGIEADKVVDTLQMLGDAAMGDSQKLQALTLAYSQTNAAGKLNGQDALQMINAGIPIYALLGKTMGVTAGEAKELASQGKVSAEIVTQAIKEATSEGGKYFNAMEAQSKTFNGMLSTLKDNAMQFLGRMSEGLSDIAKNKVLPKITEYMNDLSKAFEKGGFSGMASELGNILGDALTEITNAMPKFIDMGVNVIKSLIKGIKDNAPALAKNAVEVAMTLADGLLESLPTIVEAGTTIAVHLVASLISEIPNLIPKVAEAAADIVVAFGNAITEGLFGYELPAHEVSRKFEELLDSIGDFDDLISSTKPQLADYNGLLSTTGNTVADLDKKVTDAENHITEVYGQALKEQRGLRDEDLESIRHYTDELYAAQNEKLELYRGQQVTALRKLQAESDTITKETAAQHIANAQAALDETNRVTEEKYNLRITQIENANKAGQYINDEYYQNALEAAKIQYDAELLQNAKYYEDVLTLTNEKTSELYTTTSGAYEKIAQAQTVPAQYAVQYYRQAVNDLDVAWMDMQLVTVKGGGKLNEENKKKMDEFLGVFKALPPAAAPYGEEVLQRFIDEYGDEIPELKEVSGGSMEDMIAAIESVMGMQGGVATVPQKIGETAGQSVAKGVQSTETAVKDSGNKVAGGLIGGLLAGINTGEGSLLSRINSLATTVVNRMKSAMGIASPSKVMAEIGRYMDEGLAVGITANMDIPKLAIDELAGLTMDGFKAESYVSIKPSAQQTLTATAPVVLELDGREVARASAWWTGEQLAWEEM